MIDSSDPVTEGNVLAYNITVTNNGPGNANGVTVTDILPVNATFLLASSGCTYSVATVTCSVGNLSNGASTSVQILLSPTHSAVGTALSNSASVATVGDDPTASPAATEGTLVIAAAAPTVDALQIFFDSMNNTGFGTTSPVFNDDGTTGANVGKYFAIDGVVPGGAAYLGLGGTVTNPTDRVGFLNFYNRALGGVDGRTATIGSFNDGELGKGNLVFSTAPNNVGPISRMIIGSEGNVAINRPHAQGATLSIGGQTADDSSLPLAVYDGHDLPVMILTSTGKLSLGSTSAPKELLQVGPTAGFSVNDTGRVFIGTPGEGIILKSPNGLVCSKLTIDNSGALTTAIVPCP